MSLTRKQKYVIELLEKDPDMSTKDIIDSIAEIKEVISARHVQRIRKQFNEKKGKSEMKDEDVFDTNDNEEDTAFEWSTLKRKIVETANQGGMSIQSIAEINDVSVKIVKDVLNNYHYMVMENVLDEEYKGVYFIYKDVPAGGVVKKYDVIEVKKSPKEKVNLDGNDDFWEVEIDCVSACSKAKQKVEVLMNRKTREKAVKFMNWAKAREWLAYLVGEKIGEAKYLVVDLYLPEQGTSAGLVNNVIADEYNHQTIIGVIHSHHEMGAGDEDRPSFSSHDSNFINGNHDLSLLAGRDSESGGFKIVGIARVKTPCGALMKVKAEVKALKEDPSDEEKALKDEFFAKAMSRGNGFRSGQSKKEKKNRYFSNDDDDEQYAARLKEEQQQHPYHFVSRDELRTR